MPQQMEVVTKTSSTNAYVEFADAHCHLDLFQDLKSVLKEANKYNITTMITAGINAKSNSQTLELVANAAVFGVIGIGPDFAAKELANIKDLEKTIKKSNKIVGIGEIGLDYKINVDMSKQREAFSKQLDIAKDLDMPVVVHARQASDEVMQMLHSKGIKHALFHFFEGDETQAKSVVENGYLISVPPAETSKRKRVIKTINLKHIVTETDSPIVGKTPIDVIKVAELVSQIKGVDISDVAYTTTNNLREFFYI